MAQVVFTLCDIHDQKGEQVEADAGTVPVKFGRREIEADLCTDCNDLYFNMLETLFDVGRRPGRTVSPQARGGVPRPQQSTGSSYKRDEPDGPDGTFLCRWDGGVCERQDPANGFTTSQGRGMHERRAHDFHLSGKAARDRQKEPVHA